MFIVGHFGGEPRRKVFPITRSSGQALTELTQGLADAYRVYDPAGVARTLKAEAGGVGAKTGLYAIPVLTPDRLEKRQDGRRFKEPGEPMFTLTAQDRHGVLELFEERADEGMRFFKDGICGTVRAMDSGGDKRVIDTTHGGVRIRRLTPLECFRLQGFPDEFFHRAKAAGVSDSQLYKQAGNAVTVNVVYEIAKRLG